MANYVSRRAVGLSIVLATAAGIALAQGYGGGSAPGSAGPTGLSGRYPGPGGASNGVVKLKVAMSDGQVIEMNCQSVDIVFSSGGQLRVNESGALPVTPTPSVEMRFESSPTPSIELTPGNSPPVDPNNIPGVPGQPITGTGPLPFSDIGASR
ncbi:MAG: hypothetical protein SGJ19_14610 [Planctomycetia bacterium]|nr:hypothetical protein [Planctomycetia bacterium]